MSLGDTVPTPLPSHIQSLPLRPLVTTRTHEVFALALRRAERLGHEDVTPTHVALAMIEEGHSVALALLNQRGVPLDVLEQELEAELPPATTPHAPRGELPWTPGIERVLDGAAAESRALGKDYRGVEHVLLGLLRDAASTPARVLAKHGVTYEDIRNEMGRMHNTRPDT